MWNLALGSQARHTPSRQHLCQLHAPAIYMLLPLGLQGNNSYSYMPLPSAFQGVQACLRKATTLTATSFARPQTFTLSAGLQGNNSYSYMPLNTSVSYMPQPSTCSCCLPGLKPSKLSAGLQGNNSCSYMPLPSAFQGVQACPTAICFSGGSRLPFARPQTPQTPQTLPQASKYMPLPSAFQGFKPVLQLHAPAICFSGGSRLPFARPQTPQTPQTLPQASKGTTLTSIHVPAIRFSRGSRLPFARPQTPQTLPTLPWQQLLQPPKRFQPSRGNNSYSYIYMPLQGNNSYIYTCPCHLFFRGFKTAVCPASNPLNTSVSYMPQLSTCSCCLLGLKPSNTPQASKATTLTATCP